MKKLLYILFLFPSLFFAQVPKFINYEATAYDLYRSKTGNIGGFSSENYWSSESSKTGNCKQSYGFS